jgi:hypothetical protein
MFSLSPQIGRAARDDGVDYADKYVKREHHKMVQFDAGKLREQPTGHQPEFALRCLYCPVPDKYTVCGVFLA